MKLLMLMPILFIAMASGCGDESSDDKKPNGDTGDATANERFSGSCFVQPSANLAWPLCTQYDNNIKNDRDTKASCQEFGGVWSNDPCKDEEKVAGCKIVGSTSSNPQPIRIEWVYVPGTVDDAKDICGEGDNQTVVLP